MSESVREWTNEQQAAITTIDRNLLVSAAAGSGKTSVLAERCVYLICDAPPPLRCDVNELLVVTFTRAAAAEMRHRIETSLRSRAEAGDRRLLRQIQLLDNADVSTLHSFCTRFLRQHFMIAGLDPAFTTLDDAEALLLRNDICRRVIQATYEAESGDSLSDFVDRYCNGNDESLRRSVLRIFDLRSSTIDPAAWTVTAIKQLEHAAGEGLHHSSLGCQFLSLLRFEVDSLIRQATWLERFVAPEAAEYTAQVSGLREEFSSWKNALESANYAALQSLVAHYLENVPPLPRVRGGTERAKKSIKALKDRAKESVLASAVWFNLAELQASAAATIPVAQLLLELVDSFERQYWEAKQALRAVDFADLERLTFNVLTDPADRSQPSQVAAAYRGRFRHVLVDEYQDINALQDRILQLVSRPAHSDAGGNLFCVGDVKQSIYRFRLADPSQFLHRAGTFETTPSLGQVINLSRNFRSDPGVVDSINAIFHRLMSADAAEIEYDDSHKLHVGKQQQRWRAIPDAVELHLLTDPTGGASQPNGDGEEPDDPGPDAPAAAVTDNDDDRTDREAELAAQLIRQLTAADTPDRFEYGDIAILLRSRKVRAEKFANRLRRRGIPVLADSTTGFFDAVEIRDVLSLLQCLDNAQQDIPLAALLRSPLARIDRPEDALARIRLAYPKLPFHEAAARYRSEKHDPTADALRRVFHQLEQWRSRANLRPLAGVIWEIFEETGYLAFCSALPDGRQREANLLALHDRARSFGQFSRQGLQRFLQFLKALSDEDDLGLPPTGDEPGNVVKVMSIHASKGLQFPVVLIPELGKAFNTADSRGSLLVDREQYISMQLVDPARRIRWESLPTLVARATIARKSLAEEMRVLYVAMTRAENKLILTGTVKSPAESLQNWRDAWSGHRGALPADAILAARSMLDWIGPAAVAIEAERGAIKLVEHPVGFDHAADAPKYQPAAVVPDFIKNLQPLPGARPPSAQAIAAIHALAWQPPTIALANAPAAIAVTSLTKTGRVAPAGESPSVRAIVKFTAPLPMPRFASPQRRLSPTEAGTITHRVLQAIDLTTQPSAAAVGVEVQRLVDRRSLTAADAAAVDLHAIAWFLDTPLCRQFTRADATLYRELPVFGPHFAPADHPLDRPMLRGQIDVLARTPDGLIIADYKTDRITEQTLAERVEFYRPQVRLYCDLIEQIAGQPVIEAALVFLAIRRVVTI